MCSSRRLTVRAAGLRSIGMALSLLVVLVAAGPITAPLGHAHTVVAALLLVPALGFIVAASVDDGRVIALKRAATNQDR